MIVQAKMSHTEVVEYFRRVHEHGAKDDNGGLGAVIFPGECLWVNRFVDYAHRLGMKNAFQFLEAQWGSLAMRRVLDLGCGRGRWSREYASRGAEVTGIDCSAEAVAWAARQMPQHRFICGDITCLSQLGDIFDVINSVTVLQHLPEESQRIVVRSAAGALKEGGYLVLMENTRDCNSRQVFPHSVHEWVDIGKAGGLRFCCAWGSNYEVLLRPVTGIRILLRRSAVPADLHRQAGASAFSGASKRVRDIVKSFIALVSFPIEWVCHQIPVACPSHCVIVFRKGIS